MTQREIDIADMQCWVFRLAQKKWNLSPSQCADLFENHRLLEYISDCYDILHVSGYQRAVEELEEILRVDGVEV